MISRAVCCAGLWLLLLPTLASAEDDTSLLKYWLDKMLQSDQSYSYEGTFVYRRLEDMMSMKIAHIADCMGGGDRLESLSGAEKSVVHDLDGVTCVVEVRGEEEVTECHRESRFRGAMLKHFERIKNYYKFDLFDSDRIAGRLCRKLVIQPSDSLRYGHRLWVDEETGLLLRTELLDTDGKVLEQLMFTDLKVYKSPPEDLINRVKRNANNIEPAVANLPESEQPKVATAAATHDDIPKVTKWRVTKMPEGFDLLQHFDHRGRHTHSERVEHMIFSDGMATVSIFIEKNQAGHEPFIGRSSMGAVNVYGSVIDDHQVTIVGEVPFATVQLIGNAIRNTK